EAKPLRICFGTSRWERSGTYCITCGILSSSEYWTLCIRKTRSRRSTALAGRYTVIAVRLVPAEYFPALNLLFAGGEGFTVLRTGCRGVTRERKGVRSPFLTLGGKGGQEPFSYFGEERGSGALFLLWEKR